MNILLSTAYLPPVEYMAAFLAGEVHIEQCENFIKQTYRNRAIVPSVSGAQVLSVPVSRQHVHNCPITGVTIDYTQSWQREHWRTLETVYNASPFFLYYKDYLYPFYHQTDIQYLFDFNNRMLQVLLKLLKIKCEYSFTTDYMPVAECFFDARNVINPKKILHQDYPFANMPAYRQVFAEKVNFIPNMSCVDLLFNEGPAALGYLQALGHTMAQGL